MFRLIEYNKISEKESKKELDNKIQFFNIKYKPYTEFTKIKELSNYYENKK